jgi:60 kDa SS-A/Ro ribonucleoprotein
MDILKTINLRWTPQSRAAKREQLLNAAGGYTFSIDDWARVHRFLTLGTDGGTYYTGSGELTRVTTPRWCCGPRRPTRSGW